MVGFISLINTLKKYLPVEKDDIEPPSKLKQSNQLESIIDQISGKDDTFAGLLIGANCTKALKPIAIIHSSDNGNYSFKMKFGWLINLKQNFQV